MPDQENKGRVLSSALLQPKEGVRERREELSEDGMGGIHKLKPLGNQSGCSRVETAEERDCGRGIFLEFCGNTWQRLARIV